MPWETLWYGVLLLSIFFYTVLDGFDLGVGALHLCVRGDERRRLFLNSIGPFWDGNEVWIVIVIGGLFAGFPNAYATLFSGLYTLWMYLIAGLIFRASAIEFRSKRSSVRWRQFWDWIFCGASILVALIIGLILGNLVIGIPLDSAQNYMGSSLDLLRPYPILVAITGLALFTMHGSIYLLMKLEGEIYDIVRGFVPWTVGLFLACYALLTLVTLYAMPHMSHFLSMHPLLLLCPLVSLGAILNIPFQIRLGNEGWAFLSSSVSIAFLLLLFSLGTFPMIALSTIHPETNSLTIYNTASSPATLKVLLTVVLIGVPFVLAYGVWIYHIFRGKVKIGATSY